MRPKKCSILNPNPERLRVMKRFYIALTVVSIALLSSCEKEKDFNNVTPLGKDDVAFSLQSASTRSTVTMAPQQGMTIKLDSEVCLEETIEEMDYASPATRGVPAYTFNVGEIYETLGVYADQGSFGGDATYVKVDEAMVANGWRYHHNYDGNPWPNETTPVDFYFSMPAQITGLSNPSYADQQITFTFDSPTNGADQKDILFSHTAVNKEDHDDNLPNGTPVTMYHALTGVKFRNGHSNDGSTKTIITKVQFKNLLSHGICTVTPGSEEGTTSKYKVNWGGLGKKSTFTLDFSSLNPTYVPADAENNSDGTISYGADSKYAGTSWTSAAADHNINDEDGSFTFWFIPQQISEDVTLEITFLVKTPDTPEGTEVPHIIKFGELVTKTTGEGESAEKTYTEWAAGQLRTYTLKPFDVDVEIFDSMSNLKKENLHVTNTGNVDEYVRIMIIGNWYGWKSAEDKAANPNNPMILVGYTTNDPNNDTMVTPWYREDDLYKTGFDSTFPGGRPLASSHWKRGTGSYFYYDTKIGAGQQLSGTDALFQYYQLQTSMIPTIYLPVSNQTARQEAVGVHLVMEVVVQAIPTTVNGTEVDCWTAWSNAVGKEIKAK